MDTSAESRVGGPKLTRIVRTHQKEPIDRFLTRIASKYGSLAKLTTSRLAEEYRHFFRLPTALDLKTVLKHCKTIGVSEITLEEMPYELSAMHVGYGGKIGFRLNARQWEGIHPLSALHEIYEIIDKRFARDHETYRRLTGRALELKANAFAACLLLPDDLEHNFDPTLLLFALRSLEPSLDEGFVPALMRRFYSVVHVNVPFIFIKFDRVPLPSDVPRFVASRVSYSKSTKVFPRNVKRQLRAILPKRDDPHTASTLSKQAYEYQGPAVAPRVSGFDVFRYFDLTCFCLPVFESGEIVALYVFGLRAALSRRFNYWLRALKPRVITKLFQEI